MPSMKKGCQINVPRNTWFSDQNTCFSDMKSFWATFLSSRSNLNVNILNLFSDIVVLLVFQFFFCGTYNFKLTCILQNSLLIFCSLTFHQDQQLRILLLLFEKFYSSSINVWEVIICFDLGDLYSPWIFQECIDLAGNMFLFFFLNF